jgi:hypothetical protein
LAPPDAKPADLGGLKHLVLIVVNSATAPETVWEEIDTAPALFHIIDQTATVQINRYTIETIELLRATFKSWRRATAAWEEPVGFHLVELDFTRPSDPAERKYLNALPTSFRLSDGQIDRLRSAAREILRTDPAFLEFVESLDGTLAEEP